MSTTFADAAWPACLSALRLDRWIAGELGPAEAEETRAHVAGCGRCGAAAETLRAGRAAPLPPLGAAAARARRPAGWGRALAALGGLAAAAGLLLLVRPGPAPGERTKGGAVAVGMWVQHGDQVRRAGPGDVVAAGDAVRFSVTTPSPAWVAVLGLDPAGRAFVHFPAGPRAERLEAGADVPLPVATRLDGTLGPEQVIGLFCDHAAPLEPVRAALEGGGDAGPPAGCEVTRWSFEKR